MPKLSKVAILGGGIMGCSLAIELARHRIRSVVFEECDEILSGASRWNEGKIHLGYMYSADSSQITARKILPGGLAFKPLLEALIETRIDAAVTRTDDIYLCHDQSVVSPEGMAAHFAKVDEMVRSHPGACHYLAGLEDAQSIALSPEELAGLTDSPLITKGFRVPERSVATRWVADRLAAAVNANPMIELRTRSHVHGVAPSSGSDADDLWQVLTKDRQDGPFDGVINALWNGRLAIDQTAGVSPPPQWSHRFRLAVFARMAKPTQIASAVIAVGPFGDIKNYNGTDLYLSWYPVGLRVESRDVSPPIAPRLAQEEEGVIAGAIFEELGRFFPAARDMAKHVSTLTVAGGWVYASASGSLSDPTATIHARKDFGVLRHGTYISIDTGKYSTAPLMAQSLAAELAGA